MPPSTWMHSCAHSTAASTATTAATLAAKSAWARRSPPASPVAVGVAGPRSRPRRPGARGVPDRRGGLLGRGQHPGAAVLDRLELADRPAELLADLRVVGGGVHRPGGDPARLGAEQGRGEAAHRGPGEAGEHPLRRARPRRWRSPAPPAWSRSMLSSGVTSGRWRPPPPRPRLSPCPAREDQPGRPGPAPGTGPQLPSITRPPPAPGRGAMPGGQRDRGRSACRPPVP